MAVMPTGAGKSLCYQLPAMLLDGPTVVVSPLIALMRDQVDALRARGIAAELINSSLAPEAQRAVIERYVRGEIRLIYVAPERFRQTAFLRALERRPPALFAVDEAHCISQWGHDFRPDYVRLGEVLETVRPARVLACTATATPEVRSDILRQLGVLEPAVHVAGFLRRNLYLEARRCSGDSDRLQRLIGFLRGRLGAGPGAFIVYASTRKRVERHAAELAVALGSANVTAYHAGLTDAERTRAQARFMGGLARVVVATTAFGMGVDRGDVRAVVHVDLPRNLEGYYQEVGRAGRDRQPAHCLLLHATGDTRIHSFLIEPAHPGPETVAAIWRVLGRAGDEGTTLAALAQAAGLDGEAAAEAALRLLARVSAVQVEGGRARMNRIDLPPGGRPGDPSGALPVGLAELGIDFQAVARHEAAEQDRLDAMRRYAEGAGCRHGTLLDYFGEAFRETCPGCDRCAPTRVASTGGVDGPPTGEEIGTIRKALSGVARAEGRFGLRKVATMLSGRTSADIAQTSLPRLSTFGILRPASVEACTELLQACLDAGLCALEGREYPRLALTRTGWAVMQGQIEPTFRPPLRARTSALVRRRAALSQYE